MGRTKKTPLCKDFGIPTGLSAKGRAAAQAVIKVARSHYGDDISGGGCRAFYTPAEWKRRDEVYGADSHVIVVYDGGELAPLCNLDHEDYAAHEALVEALRKLGLYIEECTCWYSAVYDVYDGS